MLNPYRVIDLTDHRGEMAGMVLGSLGADVIKIEPPGGCAGRSEGPFIDVGKDPERSLQFIAHNRFKRSIMLDLSLLQDREMLFTLIETADFVLDSAPPGLLASHGIDFETLRQYNDQIVQVMISPYGVDGPAADRPASDLTIAAMGGQVALQGCRDREPIRVTAPQVWRHTGVEAAAAALIAHQRMCATGQAQFVDLSAQCAMTWTLQNAMNTYAIQQFDFERMGSTLQGVVHAIQPIFACADGYLVAVPNGVTIFGLLGHLLGEELVDTTWLEEDWSTIDARRALGEETLFTPDDIRSALEHFFIHHSRQELFELGLALDVVLAPVNSMADVMNFEHLKIRGAFDNVPLPVNGEVKLPGAFANIEVGSSNQHSAAPRLDQHAEEIKSEIKEKCRIRQPITPRSQDTDRPFDGLKVLDLTWVIAGPVSVRYLADHGATVIKVESELRPDGIRKLGPFNSLEDIGWNNSHFYGDFNAGKQCIQLNLKHPSALSILKQLIAWADVLVVNWAPGATERVGIGYETCREINPSLIMLSASLMGPGGPASAIGGYGYHAAGMAGFYDVTGWPDLPPDGPWGAYTDIIVPRFIATLLTAAIDHRRRTGEGQYIDAFQFEMALHMLAPELADSQVNGYVTKRQGNRSRFAAPHGVYPCMGADRWCAVAVLNDGQWTALKEVLGNPAWARDRSLDSLEGRLPAQELIDHHLSAWSRRRSAHAAMDELTAAGIPAGAVQSSRDLANDAQYIHRNFHRILHHPEMGTVPYAGTQFRIAGYESGPYASAPMFGEHNHQVLRNIVGISEAEITELIDQSAVR